MSKSSTQTQIRLQDSLYSQVEDASELTGLSKNDIIKHALTIGLRIMQENGYDLTKGAPSREMEEFLKEQIRVLVRDTVEDIETRLAEKRTIPARKK